LIIKGTIMRKAVRAATVCLCLLSVEAWASGGDIIELSGSVAVAAPGNGPDHAAAKGEQIPPGGCVSTGDKGGVLMEFEDGQEVKLLPKSAFCVTQYRFDPKHPEATKADFSITQGGLRIDTGDSHPVDEFILSTPNATIGFVAADFSVALENGAVYSAVTSGQISITNAAASADFDAGQLVAVRSIRSAPKLAAEAELPAAIIGTSDQNSTSADPPGDPAPGVGGVSARTISITGAGPTYTGATLLCDFCTGRTKTVAMHVAPKKSDPDTVTGDTKMFRKHNLTATGANTGEICAFCHTPQGSEETIDRPTWNPGLSTVSSYQAYESLGSAVPEAAGSISMACLSCHDGTQAPNIVMNKPDLKLDIGNTQVYIGNDLKAHHPVGILYAGGEQDQYAPEVITSAKAGLDRLADMNRFANMDAFDKIYLNFGGGYNSFTRAPKLFQGRQNAAFGDVLSFSNEGNFDSLKGGFNKSVYSGTGSGTVWWIKTPGSRKGRQKTDLYLFTRKDEIKDALPSESVLYRPYIECATCHDPHSVNPTFLRMPGGNERSQICLSCHNK
jgi:predicted CXXCH cytochrome family protein